MTATKVRFGKTALAAVVTALVIAALGAGGAWALGSSATVEASPAATVQDLRLEVAWARLQAAHDRMTVMFDFADQHIADIQALLDQAKAGGKDVASLQSALDRFESALQQAQPTFDSATAAIDTHAGFDVHGSVVDASTAGETITSVAQALRDIRAVVSPAQQALQQALQAFRQSGVFDVNKATIVNLRLELAWAKLQAGHASLATFFDFADRRMAEVQQLVDRAQASGKDVSTVQSALESLQAAIQEARPLFESTTGVIASHQGFDSNGNVTDVVTAMQTVRNLASTTQRIESILKPAQQAFQQALRDFRQINQPTPTPST